MKCTPRLDTVSAIAMLAISVTVITARAITALAITALAIPVSAEARSPSAASAATAPVGAAQAAAAQAPALQAPTEQAPTELMGKPAAIAVPDARRAVLARDPARLPRAAAERWKDFDPERLSPGSIPKAFLEALAALKDGDLPRTIACLATVLDAEPDFPPALHQLGVLYFQLQRYGDARTCFERYLEVAPSRIADTRGLGPRRAAATEAG